MCLAIFKPAGIEAPEDHLRAGWIANSDGGGYAYIDNGKIVVCKGFAKLAEFLEAYKKDEEAHKGSPFLIHFRIRSAGAKSLDNTHPFQFEHGALIHNGTMSGFSTDWEKGPSDTKLFTDKYGKVLTYENVTKFSDEWDLAMGSWNKVALLYPDGKHHIINKNNGHTETNGMWYSNTTYKGTYRGVYSGDK